MGVEESFHSRVFAAIHLNRADFSSEDAIFNLAKGVGVDMSKFKAAWASFGVMSKCAAASKLSDNYRVESVPLVAVGGRFLTSPAMAGGRGTSETQAGQMTIPVINHLIGMVRAKA